MLKNNRTHETQNLCFVNSSVQIFRKSGHGKFYGTPFNYPEIGDYRLSKELHYLLSLKHAEPISAEKSQTRSKKEGVHRTIQIFVY